MVNFRSAVPSTRVIGIRVGDKGAVAERRQALDVLLHFMRITEEAAHPSDLLVIKDFQRWLKQVSVPSKSLLGLTSILNPCFVYANLSYGDTVVFLADFCDYDHRVDVSHISKLHEALKL